MSWSNDQPGLKAADGSTAGANPGADVFEIIDGTFPFSRFASFRIASVIPAPSSFLVLAGAGAVLATHRRRAP